MGDTRDVYRWLDPFEEEDRALYWKEEARFERERGREMVMQAREQAHHEILAIRSQLEIALRQFARYQAVNGPVPLMVGCSVQHIDGDPTNNDPSNLRIIANKERR